MTFIQIAQSLDPFLDLAGDAYVRIVVDGKPEPQVVPLESRQGMAVLRARLCDVLKKGYPTDHETRSAVEVVYGYAFERDREVAVAAVEYLIAQKPLAEAVLAIAHSGGTEATPSRLLAKVNTVATRQGIDTQKGPWPHSEDSLGRQLSQLVPLLESAGVGLRRVRGNERRWIIPPIELERDEGDGQATSTSGVPSMTSDEPDTNRAQSEATSSIETQIFQFSSTTDADSGPDNDELNALCNGATS